MIGISGRIRSFFQRFSKASEPHESLEARLAEANRLVGEAYQRLEALFKINQQFVGASDENEVIEPVLSMLVDLTGADGASFVPIDEHGQPQTALSHGNLPFPVLEAWLDRLASPAVLERCKVCELPALQDRPASCPLLQGPFTDSTSMFCLPVRRGEREFGIMNLFLPDGVRLDERTQTYLRALMDETALGLEGVQMRRRELDALRHTQLLRQKTDLKTLLNSLLENVCRTLEADFAMMVVPQSGDYHSKIDLVVGDFSASGRPFVDGILQGVIASKEPVMVGEVAGGAASTQASAHKLRSLLAAPLVSSEGSILGAILVGSRRPSGFHPRQMAILQTIAGQVGLVVQNASLMAELEYKTMIQERARLAREIHDGLAQTIGFLKLQSAQLRNYLAREDLERARQAVELLHSTLSEAYQDARQAIDGLRISPAECGLSGWIAQTVSEFEEVSGLPVNLQNADLQAILPSEVHAQLIRILQEALSNVRKHARASQVWVVCRETNADLVLEVRDNGLGFSPEDVSSPSRYGLLGMRERAELVGADFQVTSRLGQGTLVRVRLPLKDLEEVIS